MKKEKKSLDIRKVVSDHSALVSFLALFVVALLAKGTMFLQFNNIINILRNNSVVGIIALGMTLIIITGGIDLSVGSQLAFMGVVMINVLVSTQNIFLALLSGLLVALVVGFLTGYITAKFQVPAFITTLGTMSIYRSISQFWMNGGGISSSGEASASYIAISNTKLFGLVPMPIVIWILCAVAIYVFMTHTSTGKHVYAVGSNAKAAKLAGVNVVKVKTMVYMIGSVLILIATVVETSRLGSVNSASSGSGYEMDAIAAAVIGGTSMAGGKGTIGGTVLGTLTLGIIDNLMNLLGVNPFLVKAVKGTIIIVAVLLQLFLNKKND